MLAGQVKSVEFEIIYVIRYHSEVDDPTTPSYQGKIAILRDSMKRKRTPFKPRPGVKRRRGIVLPGRSRSVLMPARVEGLRTNSPIPFDPGLVQPMRVNRSAVEARAVELGTRRTFKVEAQVAAYLTAIRCIDLTTLDRKSVV